MEDIILQYEKDFFSSEFCRNKKNLVIRLSKDFIEYGESGSVYDRESTINALMNLSENKKIKIMQFKLISLSEDILLAHYISHDENSNSYAMRTSIWKIENNTWKLYFHQGTPKRTN
jgi:hypothetical protein